MPDAKAPPEQKPLPSFRSDNFIKVYANSANIEVTPWDVKFVFGELNRIDNVVKIEESVAVTMSPQHAKALLGVLANNIRAYEEQVGEIKLPAGPDPKNANNDLQKPVSVASKMH